MYRYGHFVHGPGVFGWLLFALFVALVALAVVALVRSWRGLGTIRPWAFGPHRPFHGMDPALNELRVRYARGEIDWNEYAHRAANLGFPVTPPGPHTAPPGPPGRWAPPPSGAGPSGHPGPSGAPGDNPEATPGGATAPTDDPGT